jgi:hypothetical protein
MLQFGVVRRDLILLDSRCPEPGEPGTVPAVEHGIADTACKDRLHELTYNEAADAKCKHDARQPKKATPRLMRPVLP